MWQPPHANVERATPCLVGTQRSVPRNTVGQRQGALLFQKFLASKIRDRLRIKSCELSRRRLFEYSLPGVDPVGLGFKRSRFNQRLRSDVLQHFPVPVRLAARHVDGIRAKVILGD